MADRGANVAYLDPLEDPAFSGLIDAVGRKRGYGETYIREQRERLLALIRGHVASYKLSVHMRDSLLEQDSDSEALRSLARQSFDPVNEQARETLASEFMAALEAAFPEQGAAQETTGSR